jgi:hypothetical protein
MLKHRSNYATVVRIIRTFCFMPELERLANAFGSSAETEEQPHHQRLSSLEE